MRELLDVVSRQDEVIGQEDRAVIYQKGLCAFRGINAFIVNSQKELWIPRRHASKDLFPLHLDASVGGHVKSGESYEEALVRETQEEINLNLKEHDYRCLCHLSPYFHKTSAFLKIYLIRSNQAPYYNPDDFVEYYWLSIDGFFNQLENGDRAKSDLPIILNLIKDKI